MLEKAMKVLEGLETEEKVTQFQKNPAAAFRKAGIEISEERHFNTFINQELVALAAREPSERVSSGEAVKAAFLEATFPSFKCIGCKVVIWSYVVTLVGYVGGGGAIVAAAVLAPLAAALGLSVAVLLPFLKSQEMMDLLKGGLKNTDKIVTKLCRFAKLCR